MSDIFGREKSRGGSCFVNAGVWEDLMFML